MIRIILTTIVFGVLIVLQYRFIGSESNWSVPSIIGVVLITLAVAMIPSKKEKQISVIRTNSPSEVNHDSAEIKRQRYQEADGPNYDSMEWHN